MKEDDSEMGIMRKITNHNINALKAHQEVSRRMRENTSEKGDQNKEFDYKKLIAHQQVARIKIVYIKEEKENLEKSTDIRKILQEGTITLETYVSCMQINTKRYVEKQDGITKLRRQMIKMDIGIQEIKKEIVFIKIKQHNDNKKLKK